MSKEKLEEYLSNLNLNSYNEEELQKIYDAVKSTVDQIEENIGRGRLIMSKLPPVMKKGCWESGPRNFGSFEFKGETITIDTEEKYLYWADKIDINKDDEDIIEMLNNNDPNFGKIWKAMEAFLFITHRIDLHHWDK